MITTKDKVTQHLDADGKPNGMVTHTDIEVYEEDKLVGKPAIKEQAKKDMKTEHNLVSYDTDTTSLVYMNAVTNLANFKFIQALVDSDVSLQPIYDAVYKSTIDWKGSDNLPHTVQIESIAEAIEMAMTSLAADVIKV